LASGGGGGGGGAAGDYIDLLTGTYSAPELAAIAQFFEDLDGDSLASGGTMLDLTGFWFRATDNVGDSALEINGGISLTDDFFGWDFIARQGVSNQFATVTNNNTAIAGIAGMGGSYLQSGFSGQEPLFSSNESANLAVSGSDAGSGGNARMTARFNDTSNKIIDFSFIFGGGAVTSYRTANQVNFVLNQEVGTAQSATDAQATGNLWYSAEGILTSSAHWYDGNRVWTAAEVQRFHGYVETLMDAFGAGVVS
jgi:hypothetical protein